jgi:plasmid stabilization system protein ParE
MTYRVLLQPRAEADLEALYQRAAEQAPLAAKRWYNQFLKSLESLRQHPHRCGMAPEATQLSLELRQFIVRSRSGRAYRALFVIEEDSVQVLSIRAPGQDIAGPEEIVGHE